MPDYDLNQLSWRSFEQLVQALALKVISPAVTIFGDGPDGGREATFEGSTNYPSLSEAWKGYGVIQAKFLQRATATSTAGAWAYEQLTAELRTYGEGSPRRNPDYFIFATNAPLSPSPGSGALDRCRAALESAKIANNWLGVDIWDYYRIRSYLDGAQDIRRTYGGWILPGDVLSTLAEYIETSRPDFHRTLRLYLEKELVSDQYVNLTKPGIKQMSKRPSAAYLSTYRQEQLVLVNPLRAATRKILFYLRGSSCSRRQ